MNWVELQWDWKAAGSLLKTYWTKLTDEDLEWVEGRRGELAPVLQKHYGYEEEEAEGAICTFEKLVRYPGAVV